MVQHLAVQRIVIILFYQIPGAENGFDIEVVRIIRYPGWTKLEKRLVQVLRDISLRVSEDDHG